jgi:hypothetical protein
MESQAAWQRAMQKAHAKASMGGQPLRTEALQQGLAAEDINRKLAFERLGLDRQRSDLAHKYRKAQYRMQKKQLKQDKRMLPWQMALGGGTALVSALEGRSRANKISRADAARAKFWEDRNMQQHQTTRSLRQKYLPNMVGERRGL